ncbi:TonB-dependent Receptor Plug Domain [Pseudobacteriovorax antillogorgiicola]|uniref:TonB-dependent Receptor Plug Domain n=1 Tax=Pseudobacteriovorax antillogorgiicola TaxID=1513793 RepID=A0A1Y6C5F0_9BACT|nr:TonB-dependent receptor-like protein [Pseudobacteriovorax antillogorgiicola]SMF36991.1 TonB-dependent Receptor Plug Domain [Pseudobacteriovorax antillogorgiicola]
MVMATFSHTLFAATSENLQDLMELSAEELLSTKVSTGSLRESIGAKSASAVTIIDRADIELTSARSLANLLEQHVPGLLLMTHSEGSKIGIRGLIAAENYKLLLLVNGKNITNMVYEGAILELDNWDLQDIERIEVVRGPGSVTYGTGAIAGVINIITRTAKAKHQLVSSELTHVLGPNSRGLSLSLADSINRSDVFTYFSYRKTDGYQEPQYYRDLSDGYLENPQAYLADGLTRPQIKALIDIRHGNEWNVWFRYTQSGQTHHFNPQIVLSDLNGNPNEEVSRRQVGIRGAIASFNRKFSLAENQSLKTEFSFDSQEYIRYRVRAEEYRISSSNNIDQYAFSQNRSSASLLYQGKFDRTELITGYQMNHITVEAPWGKSRDHIWIYEGVDFLSDVEKSVYLQNPDPRIDRLPTAETAEEIGSGLEFITHSHLLESIFNPSERWHLIYAHRLDIPDISDPMFSPRLSLGLQVNETNYGVVTAQRASRMMPLRAQYLNHKYEEKSKHETIDGLEISLTNTSIPKTTVNFRAFYNRVHSVGFTGQNLELLADLGLLGLELDAAYKSYHREFRLSHSFLDPISVDMNEGLKDGTNRNNISFADYYYQTRGDVPLLLESYGDDLNNWSNQSTKLMYIENLLNRRLRFLANMQIYWNYQGSYDEMGMYENAYANFDTSVLQDAELEAFESQRLDFLERKRNLEAKDAYQLDYSLNLAMSYLWQSSPKLEYLVTIFGENVLQSKKRYYVSTGSSNTYPDRLQFLEEPVSFGIRLRASFY